MHLVVRSVLRANNTNRPKMGGWCSACTQQFHAPFMRFWPMRRCSWCRVAWRTTILTLAKLSIISFPFRLLVFLMLLLRFMANPLSFDSKYSKFWILFTEFTVGRHSGAVASTVSLHQEGRGFDSDRGLSRGVGMFPLWLRRKTCISH